MFQRVFRAILDEGTFLKPYKESSYILRNVPLVKGYWSPGGDARKEGRLPCGAYSCRWPARVSVICHTPKALKPKTLNRRKSARQVAATVNPKP